MTSFNIKIILKDIIEAIKQNKINIIEKQIALIMLYLETKGFSAGDWVDAYLSISSDKLNLFRDIIKKLINGKRILSINNNLNLYYDDTYKSVIIEEKGDNSYTYVVLKIP